MKNVRIVAGKSGATTKVYIDGVQINNCTAIVFEAKSRDITKVTLTLLPESVVIETEEPIAVETKRTMVKARKK